MHALIVVSKTHLPGNGKLHRTIEGGRRRFRDPHGPIRNLPQFLKLTTKDMIEGEYCRLPTDISPDSKDQITRRDWPKCRICMEWEFGTPVSFAESAIPSVTL
jgi:hypothetical protein